MAHGRLEVVCVVLLASLYVITGAGAGSADAATGHSYLRSLTVGMSGVGLVEPGAMAVDRERGLVFVGDGGVGVVDVYDAAGGYVTQFGDGSLLVSGIGVDEASGWVYVADSFDDVVLVFKPDGSGGFVQVGEWSGEGLAGQGFGEVTGVAVDNSNSASAGDVYVLDGEDVELGVGVVDVFKPKPAGVEEGLEGDLVRVVSAGKLEEPNGIAVDGSGRVYVADSEKGAVYEFSPGGVAEGKLTGKGSPDGTFLGGEEEGGNVSGVAVDPTTGDLLVAEGERHVVSEFDAAGQWVGWITNGASGSLGEVRGVAATSLGEVYVSEPLGGRVDVFGGGVVVPDVVSGKASKLTRTSAILNGIVNGDGKIGTLFLSVRHDVGVGLDHRTGGVWWR